MPYGFVVVMREYSNRIVSYYSIWSETLYIMGLFVPFIILFSSGGDPVGVQMCTDPHLLVPCSYTRPVIHSISSADSGYCS